MQYKRIRELREDNDINQCEIAKMLNIKQTTYSKYELGKVNIPVDALIIIADFYHTSVDYLLGRTDQRETYPKARKVLLQNKKS